MFGFSRKDRIIENLREELDAWKGISNIWQENYHAAMKVNTTMEQNFDRLLGVVRDNQAVIKGYEDLFEQRKGKGIV